MSSIQEFIEASFGYHVCLNEDFNEFIGCDVQNMKVAFLPPVPYESD